MQPQYKTYTFEGKLLQAKYYAEFSVGKGAASEIVRTPKHFDRETLRLAARNIEKAGFTVTLWEQNEDGTRKPLK